MHFNKFSWCSGRCLGLGFPELSHCFIVNIFLPYLKKNTPNQQTQWASCVPGTACISLHAVNSYEGQSRMSEEHALIIPILQIRKLRHEEIKKLVCTYPSSKCQGWHTCGFSAWNHLILKCKYFEFSVNSMMAGMFSCLFISGSSAARTVPGTNESSLHRICWMKEWKEMEIFNVGLRCWLYIFFLMLTKNTLI